ncbi:hypothetical protein RSOLAG22IIIB_06318 [Rhizoctonia solani]|uniref:Uncharacterized protein n=1 Tax=Rhizoctonia solani TaxID=456999 RepID=A0A0K6GD42_9AGAM|nr:hypothetical protein RSOLAG22IIIB_06318 [Rhizoctonia solani]
MLALKISAILASTYMVAAMPAYSAPAAQATAKCGLLKFQWKGPKGIECLSIGGALVNSSPPNGVKCPNHYYYRPEGYCAPRFPSSGKPDCENEYLKWNETTFTCTVVTPSAPVVAN